MFGLDSAKWQEILDNTQNWSETKQLQQRLEHKLSNSFASYSDEKYAAVISSGINPTFLRSIFLKLKNV